MRKTFVEAVLAGEAKPEDLMSWVEDWHDQSRIKDDDQYLFAKDVELNEYLGMTWEEYSKFVENHNNIMVFLKNKGYVVKS